MLITSRILIILLALLFKRFEDRILVQIGLQTMEYSGCVLVDFLIYEKRPVRFIKLQENRE